jgi:hypothetical protein
MNAALAEKLYQAPTPPHITNHSPLHRLAFVNGWGSQPFLQKRVPSRFTVSNWLAFLMGQPFLQCSLKAALASP